MIRYMSVEIQTKLRNKKEKEEKKWKKSKQFQEKSILAIEHEKKKEVW